MILKIHTTLQKQTTLNLFLSDKLEPKTLYPDKTIFFTLEKDSRELGISKIVTLSKKDLPLLEDIEREDIELSFERNKTIPSDRDLIVWNTGLFVFDGHRNKGLGTLITKTKEMWIKNNFESYENIYSLALIYNTNPIDYAKIGYNVTNVEELIPNHSIVFKKIR